MNDKAKEIRNEYYREYMAEYRAKNKEKLNQKQREWRKSNPDKVQIGVDDFEKYLDQNG